MQDVRQSVYDIPRRQLSNTVEGQQPAEPAAHWSAGQAHTRAQAGCVMYSRAADTEAAAATEATQSVAGMDVRQSMYDSPQHNSALDDAWASPRHSNLGDCQILTLHSDDMQPPAAPFDQSQPHASQHSWDGPGPGSDNRQRPQPDDAHPSRSLGALPNRPSSDAHLDQQDHWQQQSEQETMPRDSSASWSLAHHGHHHQRQQVHSPADQHSQHTKHERQHELQHGGQHERQRKPKRGQHGQRELQHGQYDSEGGQHHNGTSAYIHHQAQQHSRAGEHYPQSVYEQSTRAGQGSGSTRDANRQYVDRASYPAAASARQSGLTGAAAAAPVGKQARHASKAPCQASTPLNGPNGWDLDELDVTGTASQPHSHDQSQSLSGDESSSLGSVQEAALWDLVNEEEPFQIGLTVQQQRHGKSFSQQSSLAQHTTLRSSQQASQQSSQQSSHHPSRVPSSRPSSAGSSSQVSQHYGHKPESVPASQMLQGEILSAGRWTQAGNNTVVCLSATLL